MKKAIISLILLTSLSAFIFSKISKPVPGIEVNIKNSQGEIVNSGKTDKNGAFIIKIKDKGNYVLSISSDEIIKGLTNIHNGKKAEVSYLVNLAFEAESESWTVDNVSNTTHTKIINKNATIEITREMRIGNTNHVNEWPVAMIDIISKGNGEIKGSVTCRKK